MLTVCPHFAVVPSQGMGGLRPNIVVVGYKERWMKQPAEEVDQYERLLNDVVVSDLSSGGACPPSAPMLTCSRPALRCSTTAWVS